MAHGVYNKKLRCYENLLEPTVYGVGFLGLDFDNCKEKSYSAWKGIMQRGYSPKLKEKHPTYEDVVVCKAWHDYSNFKIWFDKNYIDGYHLDKDLRVYGNKIYSPETCIFVPACINNFFKNYHRDQFPLGVMSHNGINFSKSSKPYITKHSIKDAMNDYWNNKHTMLCGLVSAYPDYNLMLTNYFEIFFINNYADNL